MAWGPGPNCPVVDPPLLVLLSILMSSVLIHGYVPKSKLRSVIVPIITIKTIRISDKDNYIPICISNVFTKVVEKVWRIISNLRIINLGCFCTKITYKILYQTWILYVCGFSRCV